MEQKMNNPMNMIVTHKKGQVDEEYDNISSFFSSSSLSSSDSQVSSGSSSLEADSFEEVTSSPSSYSSSSHDDPLNDMSSLLQQLPLKRGLSKFYEGKSQSFTSLCKVMSVEDLAKPEHPYNKKLKSCKSYGEELGESQGCSFMSRVVAKRGVHSANLRGSCSSLRGSGPPVPFS